MPNHMVRPIYAAPQQARQPLSWQAAHDVFQGWYADDETGEEFVRRVERSHGIGSPT